MIPRTGWVAGRSGSIITRGLKFPVHIDSTSYILYILIAPGFEMMFFFFSVIFCYIHNIYK